MMKLNATAIDAKEWIELTIQDLEELLERAEGQLEPEDYRKLEAVVKSLVYVTGLVEDERMTIGRLRELLGKTKSEKTRKVLERAGLAARADGPPKEGKGSSEAAGAGGEREGHGRNGSAAYEGAERIEVTHATLEAGDACPACPKGKVYAQAKPGVLVRITGQAPLLAKVYELQKLRCNLCGEVFTATPPAGVGPERYDARAASMIGLLKYGSGLPFNRLEGLQGSLGIPLPASTQWDIVKEAVGSLEPAYEELIRQAAQGEVVHNDDTSMRVLSLEKEERAGESPPEEEGRSPPHSRERTGVFTSGIVSTREGRRVALFFTGRKHAGENLADVLARRAQALGPPIQMCDALSRNLPQPLGAIVANCLAHGRRHFVGVVENFPKECRHVLEELGTVYRNDAAAQEKKLSPEERLRFHQAESAPVMEELHAWFTAQFVEHRVEPNSGLGKAIAYMLRHWEKLTLFLRQPGAPLDNNICERGLKKAILHRKNALFYKTENGARVGDVFMSLIHTCELEGADPFDYLTRVLEHAGAVAESPGDWMPWNYRERLARSP
jgi:transposase